MSTSIDLKMMFDKLHTKPACEDSSIPVFDIEHHQRSQQLLAMIDQLDRLIAADTTDKASRRKLLQARSRTAEAFTKHLDASPNGLDHAFFTADDGRSVWIVVDFTGTPTRAGRKQADEWTAAQGQPWNGNIKTLRALMRRAHRNGEKLPDSHFGLRAGRTIRIGHWSVDDAREWENAQSPLGPNDIRF